MKQRLLAIDPSIRYCGMAIFEMDSDAMTATLTECDCLSNHSSNLPLVEWMRAAIGNAEALEPFIEKVNLVVIEQPTQWGHSAKSLVSARTQSLTKLIEFVGMVKFIVAKQRKTLDTYTPQEWKGNLPKQVIVERVNIKMNLKLNPKTKDHNTAEAIGIGIKWLQQHKYEVLPCP